VLPSQSCGVWDTIAPEQRSTGKARRTQRIDRHLYSRLSADGRKAYLVSRGHSEGGRRFDHITLISIHQEILLKVNTNLPTSARIGNGRGRSR
jgi:hypothetical protein